jgi:DNA-binding response OmpR family regulator
MDKILLVDDERDIVSLLEEVLIRDGFRNIRKAYTGQDALAVCREFQPDVIVLDIMLPDIDGIEVCKRIRAFSYCSILFLSSKNDDIDKILGLASGGDDYVTKPFSPKEIVYRIKSQLRRMQYGRVNKEEYHNTILCAGDISVDTDACCAYKNGQLLDLTAKEYGILQFMMENQNKIISKERLYERIWGEESAVCDNTIMVHIRHLREKIEEDSSNPKRLKTVKGLGYKLIGGEE